MNPASQWLFDLGNSRLKCAALHEDGSIGEITAIAHDGHALDVEALQRLPQGDIAWMTSVVSGDLHAHVLNLLTQRFMRISIARSQARCGALRLAYVQPRQLGSDRFLAMLAAHRRGGAWLVVGVGTAITIDLVDAEGLHRGGRIAPSPALMRDSLHARAPHLPATDGDYTPFAATTADALASGCVGAAVGLIEHSLHHAHTLLGATPQLLLHGGGSAALLSWLPQATHAHGLVMEGLAAWVRATSA